MKSKETPANKQRSFALSTFSILCAIAISIVTRASKHASKKQVALANGQSSLNRNFTDSPSKSNEAVWEELDLDREWHLLGDESRHDYLLAACAY